jgi:hypothetical protein
MNVEPLKFIQPLCFEFIASNNTNMAAVQNTDLEATLTLQITKTAHSLW